MVKSYVKHLKLITETAANEAERQALGQMFREAIARQQKHGSPFTSMPPHSQAAAKAHEPRRERRSRSREEFVKVPVRWIEALADAKCDASHQLALYLLLEDWRSYVRGPIRVPNKRLAAFGITRWGKWRALRELEILGLIRVEPQPRRSPIVRLL